MRFHFNILLLFVTALLASCVDVPQAKYRDALALPEDAHPSPMMFSQLKMALPPGSDVGYMTKSGSVDGFFMKPASRNLLRDGISQKDIEQVFEETLEGQGYDVVDTVNVIFPDEELDEFLRSEYRVGGKIIEARMDGKQKDSDLFLGGIAFGREGIEGELYLKIEWGVYDTLRQRVVYKTVTEGTGKVKRRDPEGMTLLVNEAFEMAAYNLGADKEFHDLLVSGVKPQSWPLPKKQDDRPMKYEAEEEVELPSKPLSSTPLPQFIDNARQAVVMIEGGVGHGSGFFISQDGHILTNNHVVGNAQRVRVVTSKRKEKLVAQVLRTQPARDVALLKLEEIPDDLKITTLPIRTAWPGVTEDVYALGTPISKKLQDTVTKGIVSAHRKKFRMHGARLDIIQADVDIHGGNSGGPLLDANGNIVAISVAGMSFGDPNTDFSTGLNYFIPIGDALEKLDIGFEDEEVETQGTFDTSAMAPAKSLNVGPPVQLAPR